MSLWYKKYGGYKIEKNRKKPYRVMKVVKDEKVPIKGLKDVTIDAHSNAQARLLFLKKYPFLNDYLEIGIDIEVEVDEDVASRREKEYEQAMEEMNETVQNAWWND